MRAIKEQREMGTDGLLEEDQWLMEINLRDLDSVSGEWEHYWLVAMEAAREATRILGRSARAQEAGSHETGHNFNELLYNKYLCKQGWQAFSSLLYQEPWVLEGE